MAARKRSTTSKAPRRFSFSLSEFDEDDFGYAKVLEACNFLDLPRVRKAVKELVEAHRENKAIVAKFPLQVRKAMARLSEIQPRHAELDAKQKPGEPPSGELAGLTAEVIRLVNTIGPHRAITDRLREAKERLCKLLFLTPEAKWKEQTGRQRPKNLSELKRAMAEAGYSPDAVHAEGLTPRYAEDYLLGRGIARAEGEPTEPLTRRVEIVYQEIIEHGPLTGRQITQRTGIDQSTLTKEIIPELKRLRGIVNKRGAGYYSPRHYRPQ